MAIAAIKDLSDAAAGCGTISYNGVSTPPLRKFSLVGDYIYDDANRTVVCVEYTLDVSWFVWAATEDAQSALIANIRQKLKTPGQTLLMSNLGLGDIQVNGVGNTHRDLDWGPRPVRLEFSQPAPCATEVHWSCKFRIAECSAGDILAWNYEVTFSADEAGLWTRTITGYLQIPMRRPVDGGRSLNTSADAYRDRIRVQVPRGFRRAGQVYPLSKDKGRSDFLIIDTQLDGDPLPENIIRGDLEYTIESTGFGFQRWVATLSGYLEVAPGKPTSRAARMFLLIALDKLQKLRSKAGKDKLVLPDRIRMGTRLFGRQSSFSISFAIITCIDDIIKNGGIWEPVTANTYEKWAASMQEAWGVRGTAGLAYNPTQDAIVDLCANTSLPQIGSDGPTVPHESDSGVFGAGQITPENSWLTFENTLRAYRLQDSVQHKVADGYTPGDAPLRNDNFAKATTMSMSATVSPGTQRKDVTQYQAGPTEYILMQGKALRIKYPVAIPRLLFVNGKEVEVVKEVIDGPKTVGCFFDAPVYQARWAIIYRLKSGYISELKARKNPSICCDPADSE